MKPIENRLVLSEERWYWKERSVGNRRKGFGLEVPCIFFFHQHVVAL